MDTRIGIVPVPIYLILVALIAGFTDTGDIKGEVSIMIFVPLAAGSIAAGIVGTLVGTLPGLGACHTFFFVVVPIMAGPSPRLQPASAAPSR